ncbi:flagellar basal body rod protein FlgC [Salipiger mucosus]|uniref:Flagellar basal-body rod protein FlgC n=1 Tax=Salipiger mucosus DSM 16094 TaxID=1123237 RepID=S9QEK1_9RHOB|nr:flagellar basal body rod protein FlgC [Salipiger mucosus]EPX77998.1 Flagellar basal-body rod protein FlgC [Salipiger mucosus DSM 16094]
MDAISTIMKTAGSAMRAQTKRLEVTSENVANAQSTGDTPGADPYRRKTVTFGGMVHKASGAPMVEVRDVGRDMSDFPKEYRPNHPAADQSGYVKMPNVSTLIEMTDMREASRAYEANMNMLTNGRRMRSQMIQMMK